MKYKNNNNNNNNIFFYELYFFKFKIFYYFFYFFEFCFSNFFLKIKNYVWNYFVIYIFIRILNFTFQKPHSSTLNPKSKLNKPRIINVFYPSLKVRVKVVSVNIKKITMNVIFLIIFFYQKNKPKPYLNQN